MNAFFSWQHAIIKSTLDATAKHVCLTIGCHMAADGSGCFPSYQTIADESGLSRRTVIYAVERAAAAGYLTVESRSRENGSSSSNCYRPTMGGGGAPDALGGASAALGGGAPDAPPITDQYSNRPINKKERTHETPCIRLTDFLQQQPNGLPPTEWGAWAHTSLGWNAERISFEWDDFSDYWNSGNAVGGGRKRDWPATWRSHCRRNAKNSSRGGGSGSKPRDAFATAAAASLANRYGVSPDGKPVRGWGGTSGTGEDTGTGRNGLAPGDIPF